jgi:glycine/D-amino acid oxidase-like deaminating enzyme
MTVNSSARIVICGAGLAGISAAYYLAVEHGQQHVVLVEQGNPLSLTSDKSTEAYRNWWPGPDWAMTAFMNRSIDLMEGLARATDNRINLNRRGYVFATAEASKIAFLQSSAALAETRGGGPARLHETASSPYVTSPAHGFDFPLTGADVITSTSLIRREFPYLAPETVAVVHARRAGWLSAQQLGMVMLEAIRERGVKLRRGQVVGVDTTGGRVRSIHIEQQGARQSIEASHLVLAAGPMLGDAARLIGVDLPVRTERHFKVSFADPFGAMRPAPMLIWLDEQVLPWSDEERTALADDEDTRWLTGTFPWGVHGRPEGAGANSSFIVLFNHDHGATDVVFPLPEPPHYAEIALRGMANMVPGLKAYFEKASRPFVDGGYYVRTRENRPLIGPLPVEGAYVTGAYSGFGVMASCAGGDLLARHITQSALPGYAPAFALSRYEDAAYCATLATWGDDGQL